MSNMIQALMWFVGISLLICWNLSVHSSIETGLSTIFITLSVNEVKLYTSVEHFGVLVYFTRKTMCRKLKYFRVFMCGFNAFCRFSLRHMGVLST